MRVLYHFHLSQFFSLPLLPESVLMGKPRSCISWGSTLNPKSLRVNDPAKTRQNRARDPKVTPKTAESIFCLITLTFLYADIDDTIQQNLARHLSIIILTKQARQYHANHITRALSSPHANKPQPECFLCSRSSDGLLHWVDDLNNHAALIPHLNLLTLTNP